MQVQELVGIVPWNFIATICNLFIQVYLITPQDSGYEYGRAVLEQRMGEMSDP